MTNIIKQVRSHSDGVERVLVSLDFNHTHEHLLAELNAYVDLVSVGSYCIVFCTVVEDIQAGSFADRAWYVSNKPKNDANECPTIYSEFDIDKDVDNNLLISEPCDGYLKSLLNKRFKGAH